MNKREIGTTHGKLHWLSLEHRILFKYNLLFKAIKFNQPPYLSSLIRSSSLTQGNRLSVSTYRPSRQIGRCSFAVLPLLNRTSCPRLSDHKIWSVVSTVNLRHTSSDWHIPLPCSSLAGRSHNDNLFCLLDFPF